MGAQLRRACVVHAQPLCGSFVALALPALCVSRLSVVCRQESLAELRKRVAEREQLARDGVLDPTRSRCAFLFLLASLFCCCSAFAGAVILIWLRSDWRLDSSLLLSCTSPQLRTVIVLSARFTPRLTGSAS